MKTKAEPLSPDMLHDARYEMFDMMGLLGRACEQLGEAIGDAAIDANIIGASVVCGDFLDTLTELERKGNEVSVMVAKWKMWADAATPTPSRKAKGGRK